jgi:hypothetical protein
MKPLSVWTYFQDLQEPRVERTRRHKRMDIVVIRVMAVIAYGDGWDEVLERLPAALQAIRSACRRLLRAHACASSPHPGLPPQRGKEQRPRRKRVPVRPVTKAFRHTDPRAFGLGSCQRATRPGTFPRCGGRPGWGLEPGRAARHEPSKPKDSLLWSKESRCACPTSFGQGRSRPHTPHAP